MSIAALTVSTDSGLIRATVSTLQLRGEREGKAVGHAGDVVDRLLHRVAEPDQVAEDLVDDGLRAIVVMPRLVAEIHAVEHEAPEREHRLADLGALTDVARVRGGNHDVVDERVDPPRALRAEDLDLLARELVRAEHAGTHSVVDVVVDVCDTVDELH